VAADAAACDACSDSDPQADVAIASARQSAARRTSLLQEAEGKVPCLAGARWPARRTLKTIGYLHHSGFGLNFGISREFRCNSVNRGLRDSSGPCVTAREETVASSSTALQQGMDSHKRRRRTVPQREPVTSPLKETSRSVVMQKKARRLIGSQTT
jgi:hypothetical protein